jgi:hypothetical protein
MVTTEAFIGPKNAQHVNPITMIDPTARSPVGTFLPPLRVLIQVITGLRAREISSTNRRDNKMGERRENVRMKTRSAAPRIIWKEIEYGLGAAGRWLGMMRSI